jgi:hypothetical protein
MQIPHRMVWILAVIALLGIAGSAYFYAQYQDIKNNPGKVGQEEVQKLVNQVSKLIVLPTDELPTVATVTDPDQLKSQPFFAHAAKGDKVLIYTNAKKAVLFDPAQNKIIEVAPINIGSSAPAAKSETANP